MVDIEGADVRVTGDPLKKLRPRSKNVLGLMRPDDPQSQAVAVGVKRLDKVLKVNGVAVDEENDSYRLIHVAKQTGDQKVVLTVERSYFSDDRVSEADFMNALTQGLEVSYGEASEPGLFAGRGYARDEVLAAVLHVRELIGTEIQRRIGVAGKDFGFMRSPVASTGLMSEKGRDGLDRSRDFGDFAAKVKEATAEAAKVGAEIAKAASDDRCCP